MLLNPDTEVLDDALIKLRDILLSNEKYGVVAPHTLNSDGTHQSTRRRFPTLLTGIFESTWFESFAPQKLIDNFRVMDKPNDGTYPVDWAQGSALMARRGSLG